MRKTKENDSSIYSSESKRRKTIGLTIRPDLLAKAREINLNLSKTHENNIKQLIKSQNKSISFSEGSLSPQRESSWWTERDLNPRPPECKSGIHTRLNYRPLLFFALFDDRS
jgi:post-segregation antitoxin (ccd killing protein)